MNIRKYLEEEHFHEITKYSSHGDYVKNNVAFTGAPKKHPYDKDKIILITDPFSSHTMFYEFNITDIVHIDELPRMVSESGDSLQIVRIWVKKGSLGIRYEPFVVEDTLSVLKDSAFSLKQKNEKA